MFVPLSRLVNSCRPSILGERRLVLRESSALNLNVAVRGPGQRLDGNAAAGGLVGEPLGVLLVHGLRGSSTTC